MVHEKMACPLRRTESQVRNILMLATNVCGCPSAINEHAVIDVLSHRGDWIETLLLPELSNRPIWFLCLLSFELAGESAPPDWAVLL